MKASGRSQFGSDQGFTVMEVVISMAILFFAMTALIGLMGASTNMTASAKSKSVLTNVIAAELDYVRALPFDQVALTSGSPAGVIPPTRTLSRFGFTIVLNYSITDRVENNSTKEVRVSGTATRAGFPDSNTSSFAVIRDRVGGAIRPGDENGPVIAFTANTPAPEAVIGGANINVEAYATVEDANITGIDMRVDAVSGSQPLRNGNTILSGESSYQVIPPSPESTWSFPWDTRQVDDGGQREIRDGRRTVTIMAYDDKSRPSAPQSRTFIVDNDPPELPTGLVGGVTALSDMTQELSVSWTPALDGDNIAAPRHEAEVYWNTNRDETLRLWTPVGGNRAAPATMSALPFSAYAFRVRAFSHGDREGGYAGSAVAVTRPLLTGSYNAVWSSVTSKWTYTHSLKLPKATQFWSAISLILERTEQSGAVVNTDITSAATAAWAANQDYELSNVWVGPYRTSGQSTYPPKYRLKVTVTPQGYGGGAPVLVYSNYVKASDLVRNTATIATSPLMNQTYTRWW